MSANIILDSCTRAVSGWDVITSMIKSWVFGTIIAIVRALCHKPANAQPQNSLRLSVCDSDSALRFSCSRGGHHVCLLFPVTQLGKLLQCPWGDLIW